ncbi:MAG: ATP-binding protein [Nitriliruptoraceae bacterium]
MSTRADPGAHVSAGPYAHLAGLFATRADLVANVVDFVTPALRDTDGTAVVVGTPDHHAGIVAALTEAGFDPESDRCVFLDVDAMLESFLRGGAADRGRFRATVGGALDEHLDAGRHVRVYAEFAGRLWERGEVATAMHVEELVDELARDRSFVLLCAYPTELFGEQDADAQALQKVCGAHTGIVHGDLLRSDVHAGRAHLAEVLHQEVVARAMDHQAVRRERDALRRALQDAANRTQARREFTAMVAHDIRTPTTVISGLTELLQQRMAELSPARVADFLATIMLNTERIERLLDDILSVAQLDSDGFRYALAPVDLRAVVTQVATEIRQSTARAVDVSAEPDLPPALADSDRQMQVLHNLLSNAAKFSGAGTPISVRIERRADRLLVHVRDHGRGIATHELDRLFEPFVRLDGGESEKVSGTGLGLYITKELVEGQGGTIDIASTPGQGTTVTYTVPIADTG